ncbi:MAG: general secretion pathway protein GspF [bacterium]|nr:MAG: general secretion pathway protein GspF [bacterium]
MPTFSYKARSYDGRLTEGDITAQSRNAAADKLMRSGCIPSRLMEKSDFSIVLSARRLRERMEKVGVEELILFTSRLGTLFHAGIPLLECFNGLIEQAGKPVFKKTLTEVKTKLEGGASLHESMRDFPKVFSETYVNMIMAGEISGTLDESLEKLTSLLETQFDTQNRIKEVTRYPKIVLVSLAGALVVLLTFVAPRFTAIFQRAGLELPMPTKILITANSAFQNYWFIALLAAAAGCALFYRYISTRSGRYNWHCVILRIPFIGSILLEIIFGQFCHVLSNLIKSGVPILQSIEIAAHSTGNVFLMKIFREVGESVREGTGMAEPLKRFNIVPQVVTQMIDAGENSGSLDEMLLKVADYYQQGADRNIKRFAAFLEPALIIALGGIVLFIALAVFLPMWDMTKIAVR